MGNDDGGRSPDEIAREHEKIQREIENRTQSTEGGLEPDDIDKVAKQQSKDDFDRLQDERMRDLLGDEPEEPTVPSGGEPGRMLDQLGKTLERRFGRPTEDADERRERDRIEEERSQERLDHDPNATESILDEIDDTRSILGPTGGAPDEASGLTGGMLDALKRPGNMIRLVAAGLGLIGLLLLFWGLRSESLQAPGAAVASPTTAATAAPTTAATAIATPAGSPITQAPPTVTGTATANASFTKVSGPCNLAARFTDTFSFAATNGALTLTQLSVDHVTTGTIEPNGDFATMAEGQAYRGRVTGTTVEGQHQYTGGGCNEIYDFTMELSEPLLPAATIAPTPTTPPTPTPPPPTATPAPAPAASPTTGASGPVVAVAGDGPNVPLSALGFILVVAAIALFFGGAFLASSTSCPDECSTLGAKRNCTVVAFGISSQGRTPDDDAGIELALELLRYAPLPGMGTGIVGGLGKTVISGMPSPVPLPGTASGAARGPTIDLSKALHRFLNNRFPQIWIKVSFEECRTTRCIPRFWNTYRSWETTTSEWTQVREGAPTVADPMGVFPKVSDWTNVGIARAINQAIVDTVNAMGCT